MSRHRYALSLAPLLVVAMALSTRAGATTSNAAGPNAPQAATVRASSMIDHLDFGGFGGGTNPQVNYNPYSPNTLTSAYTFEPLYLINSYNCKQVPWLATSHQWKNASTLIFTIRSHVKWNDGKAFTPADVLFTYNLLKKYPPLDTFGVWQALSKVSVSGNRVTMTFKEPSVNMFQRVSSVLIVPERGS